MLFQFGPILGPFWCHVWSLCRHLGRVYVVRSIKHTKDQLFETVVSSCPKMLSGGHVWRPRWSLHRPQGRQNGSKRHGVRKDIEQKTSTAPRREHHFGGSGPPKGPRSGQIWFQESIKLIRMRCRKIIEKETRNNRGPRGPNKGTQGRRTFWIRRFGGFGEGVGGEPSSVLPSTSTRPQMVSLEWIQRHVGASFAFSAHLHLHVIPWRS